MNKKQLLENIIEKHNKYSDLLWYSRISPENINIKGVKENKKRIQELYPTEIEELLTRESDWPLGFNSGMVAALRYILTMDELGLGQADEEFPDLDS